MGKIKSEKKIKTSNTVKISPELESAVNALDRSIADKPAANEIELKIEIRKEEGEDTKTEQRVKEGTLTPEQQGFFDKAFEAAMQTLAGTANGEVEVKFEYEREE